MSLIRKCSSFILSISFLMTGISYGIETYPESKNSSHPTVITEVPQQKPNPSGFMEKMEDNIHQAIREERVATLSEIDKERKATLVYLTHERLAVTEDLKTELNRLTEKLVSERKATLAEMEAISDRLFGRALVRSKSLIDHFFVRLLQLIIFIGVAEIVIFFIFFKSHTKRKTRKIMNE